MIKEKEKQTILEYLRNETDLTGQDIMSFERAMKEKKIFR
jgi:hypothetical protein